MPLISVSRVSAVQVASHLRWEVSLNFNDPEGDYVLPWLEPIVDVSVALTGASASGQVGSLGTLLEIQQALTGVQSSGDVGTVVASFLSEVLLTGVEAVGQVGDLLGQSITEDVLTGVQATGSVGDVEESLSAGNAGVGAVGYVGQLAAAYIRALTGVIAAADSGTITVGPTGPFLHGVAATGRVGSVFVDAADIVGMTIDSPVILTPTFTGPITLENGIGALNQVFASQGPGNTPEWVDAAPAPVLGSFELTGLANGQLLGFYALTELTTVSTAAFTDTVILLPAGAIIQGVSVRVVTVIPTATNFDVGDSGSATRFNTVAVNVAAGSTDRGTKAGAFYNSTATAIRLTMNGGVPAAATGQVRVTIHYWQVTPPSS